MPHSWQECCRHWEVSIRRGLPHSFYPRDSAALGRTATTCCRNHIAPGTEQHHRAKNPERKTGGPFRLDGRLQQRASVAWTRPTRQLGALALQRTGQTDRAPQLGGTRSRRRCASTSPGEGHQFGHAGVASSILFFAASPLAGSVNRTPSTVFDTNRLSVG